MSEFAGISGILVFIFVFVIIILIIRLFGAWMLRINELIRSQALIIQELKKMNGRIEQFNMPIKEEKATSNKTIISDNDTLKNSNDKSSESDSGKIVLPITYKTVTIKHTKGQPETISQKQWEKLKNKYGEGSYKILGFDE